MRFPRLARFLARHVVPRRKPDRCIGGESNPYMLRWFLIPRNPVLNVYLHNILRSDDDRALHDHPWVSVSLMLSGPLMEAYRPDHRKPETQERVLETGQVVFRAARFSHRLVVVPGTLGALTLFITGPRIRKWGFWCPHSWRYWRDFADGEHGETVGRGCD